MWGSLIDHALEAALIVMRDPGARAARLEGRARTWKVWSTANGRKAAEHYGKARYAVKRREKERHMRRGDALKKKADRQWDRAEALEAQARELRGEERAANG